MNKINYFMLSTKRIKTIFLKNINDFKNFNTKPIFYVYSYISAK